MMNFEFTLKYYIVKDCLIKDYGYSPKDAAHIIKRLRKADSEILKQFMIWFKTLKIPEQRYGGVTIREIMEQTGQKVPAAFLSADWLLREPEAAKYAMTSRESGFKAQNTDPDKIIANLKKLGVEMPESPPENCSDITLTEETPEEDKDAREE